MEIYYRLLAYKPDETTLDRFDDCPDVIDFDRKENALSVARCLMEMGLNKTEGFSCIEVYEMHPYENRSESVLTITF